MFEFKSYINPNTESFLGYLKTPERIVIPPYQRPYTWGVKNVNDFWNDIFLCLEEVKKDNKVTFKKKRDNNTHFLGTIYVQKPQVKGDVVDLIDGQQRVTTTFLLFRAIIEFIKDFRVEASETDYFEELNLIYKEIEEFLYGKLNAGLRLSLGSVDQLTMESIFESTSPSDYEDDDEDSEDENEKHKDGLTTNSIIKRNYGELNKLINKKLDDMKSVESDGVTSVIPESYTSMITLYNGIKTALEECFYVVVSYISGNEGNTFKMFENINTRGKQLDPIDKIKNKFFYYVYDQFKNTNISEYNNLKDRWSELILALDNKAESFIRFTLALEAKKFITNKALYDEVLDYIQEEKKKKGRSPGFAVKNFVATLTKYTPIYRFIEKPLENESPARFKSSRKTKYKEHIIQEISYINRFELLKPVLLKSMIEYENKNIDEETLYEIVNTASSFFAMIKIADRSPKDYFSSILKITFEFFARKYSGEKISFREVLFEKTTKPFIAIKEVISERDTLIKKIASLSNFEINKILIYKVEAAMQESNLESIPSSKYEVEHIWPVNGDGDWLDKENSYFNDEQEANLHSLLSRVGNLVILEGDYNKSNKNLSFEKKLINFEKSKRNTVNHLLEWVKDQNIDFDYESIYERSKNIAEYIVDNKVLTQQKSI
jgi:uncharacterized protein with ParB-like and HNH nuclease domain